MRQKEVHLEQLIGRPVIARSGKTIGHIEEIRLESQGGELLVQQYLLGPYALLERLSPGRVARALRQALGSRFIGKSYIVEWDKLDLTDPERPRLHCSLEKLMKLRAGSGKSDRHRA
jgi:sporulation protein YlmC with PRC-barrel domain